MASPSQATFHDIPNNTKSAWWKDGCLRWNVFYSLGSMICPFYLGYDQSLLTGLQALPQWNSYFDNPTRNWLGLISACIFIPGIVVGFPAAWLCSTIGRKWCVIFGSVVIIAGCIWNALSTSTVHFMVSRVIIGAGGSISKVAAPALLQETAHPRLRAPLANMYYGIYYVGSLLSALMCIVGYYIDGPWGWRLPCMVAIVGPIAVIAILTTAPESPRYLIKKKKQIRALEILAKYHANGDSNDALVQWELREIEEALELEELSNKYSYLDFLKTRGNRHGLFVYVAYLSPALKAVGITNPVQLVSINAGIAAWNLIIAETAGLHADTFGRRPLLFVSTIGMIISYAFVMGFSAGFTESGGKNPALGIAAIPFLFLFYGFYDIGWTPLNFAYCAEIMPFNLRAKGLAVYVAVQNLANGFNQFVNPIALEAIQWRYYAVYIAVDLAYLGIIYFFFPETKRLSIEEVAVVFDYGRERAAAAFEGGPKEEKGDTSKAPA